MDKLIAACLADLTNTKALDRLAKYDRKHPFARILLSPSDQRMVQILIGSN